jgi:NTP pyrophosphatase (non-canonical NTP hydrolase)
MLPINTNDESVNPFEQEKKPVGFERRVNIFSQHAQDAKAFLDEMKQHPLYRSIVIDHFVVGGFLDSLIKKIDSGDESALIEYEVWCENSIKKSEQSDQDRMDSFILCQMRSLPNYSLYQVQASRFANQSLSFPSRHANAVLGMISEFGEFVGVIRSILFKGKRYDQERLLDELGDFLWYFAYWNTINGISMNYAIYKKDYEFDVLSNRIGCYVKDAKYFDEVRCSIILGAIKDIHESILTVSKNDEIHIGAHVAGSVYWNGRIIKAGEETYLENQRYDGYEYEFQEFSFLVSESFDIMAAIHVLASVLGLSVKTALGNNLKKLQGRYPDGSFRPDSERDVKPPPPQERTSEHYFDSLHYPDTGGSDD